MTSTPNDDEIDDPGRDPKGLHPPRDILDAATGMPEEGSFSPPRGDLEPLEDDPQRENGA